MPRSPAPEWRRRKEPIVDPHIHAAVAHVNGIHNPDTGHYGTLIYGGIEGKERAAEIKRAFYRCAKYLGYSMSAKVEKAGNGYQVRFTVIDKKMARKYVLDTYGPDRSKWAYDPRRKGNG